MKKPVVQLLIGIALMIIGGYSSTLTDKPNMHYFGNGVFFGVGLVLLILGIKAMNKEKKKENS